MSPKIKNILIFVGIGLVLILGYIFFLKPAPAQPSLTSTSDTGVLPTDTSGDGSADANSAITQDFLSLLLSVKSITLDDSIFSTPAFNSLQDSTIILTPDGTQGRPNPFAPIGTEDSATAPASAAPGVSTSSGDSLTAPSQINTKPPAGTTKTSKTTSSTGKTGTSTK